jgi:hypothetical protein
MYHMFLGRPFSEPVLFQNASACEAEQNNAFRHPDFGQSIFHADIRDA